MNVELKKMAKDRIGTFCKVCPICNGLACRGQIPGPGGKGTGEVFVRNYNDLRQIGLNMDTLSDVKDVDLSMDWFGNTLSAPIFAGPIGAVKLHYSDLYNDYTFSKALLQGCHEENTLAFTGDGVDDAVFLQTAEAIKDLKGHGIPTIKPWAEERILEKIKIAEYANVKVIAMDIDAAGLPILSNTGKGVSPKSEEALKSIIESTHLKVILKGIMTVDGAIKALNAGASGIVVSNHGGRVLDDTPSTISVLEEIVEAVNGRMKIFIDGGFRSGNDVFKALALGADGVIIARPFVTAVYADDRAGVKALMSQYKAELRSAMLMTGCSSLDEISKKHIRKI